ncbi:class I SAM-dependent methyltransferase [Labedaea rhizosphaerae]|uniref:S-adenosyl-L-methionine-dependent methyltransferase n=1 Tax=Labedaea rhizosphaerae TaxID=598644 RepID=A0A4R6SDL6_LABRH|nr:SAM-dependent methyltransferase [Labedaea rhizosphaerae]TDP98040.1 methyltransferase (TIGR00027 family) [Labedaea rhizosphaerae]
MSEIADVSDTARWVATFRARESSRPDALFHDPYAALLAGERGEAMVAQTSALARNGWSFTARTKLIDDLITDCLGDGCDRVVNLAAGLDARPYRLDVPDDLVWVEADLPVMVEEKERALADEKPRCELVRRSVDLADAKQRKQFLAAQVAGAQRAVVITEGLLPYLADDDVRAMSADLAEAGVRWWITDMMSPADVRIGRRVSRKQLASTPVRFGPEEGTGFFAPDGWTEIDAESVLRAAARFKRLPWPLRPLCLLPVGKFGSTVVRLARG